MSFKEKLLHLCSSVNSEKKLGVRVGASSYFPAVLIQNLPPPLEIKLTDEIFSELSS